MARLPVSNLTLEVGGGGNWDDDSIEKFGSRLGLRLTLKKKTKSDVKRPVRRVVRVADAIARDTWRPQP